MATEAVTAFKCDRIVLEDGIASGVILVDSNGKISRVITDPPECEKIGKSIKVIEVNRGVLMPGVVDSHVHINSPGRSQWEDFPCATRAAAAGGVTMVADMPLNSIPPTTTLENLRTKASVARDTVYVDVAFWGGVIPGNQNELLAMIAAGVVGFKCFLCPSGVDEFPHVTKDDLEKALQVLQKTTSVLAFHAECDLESPTKEADKNPNEYETYLASRPPDMELKALQLISQMADLYKARLHIVHVSAVEGLSLVEEMKRRNVQITAETCPHYLTLQAETVPPCATQYKCAPPVRSSSNREELWKCVSNGSIDMIVSDHSPCTAVLKTDDFLKAWGGISSLQFGLSLVWSQASARGLGLPLVSQLMSAAPARLCGLQHLKGAIKLGMDADFIVFDPEDSFTVTKECIHFKNKLTPYLGMELRGRVLQTYLRGQLIYDRGTFCETPRGKLILSETMLS